MGALGRVVVCGADGFVGNNLTRHLVAQGEEVRCMVPGFADRRALADLDVPIVAGDVLDPASLEQAFAGADVVINVAGVIAIVPGRERLMEAVNVAGARNVAAACAKAGVRRLCHTSSCHALKEPPHGQVFDERQPFDPDNWMYYGRTKANGALAVMETARRTGLPVVIACPTGIVGPYDYRPSEVGGIILDFARGRLRAVVPGGFDFVDVRDVAAGLALLAGRGRPGEYYLLGGERVEVAWIVDQLRSQLGERCRPRLLSGPLLNGLATLATSMARLTGEAPRITPDSVKTLQSNSDFSCAKAVAEVGYSHRPLAETLVDTVAWFRSTGQIR